MYQILFATELGSRLVSHISAICTVSELAEYYSSADVFVNPTYADSFPTVNMEALACGTPVITYKTGGSPEIIDDNTGIVIKQGDLDGLVEAINSISEKDKDHYKDACRHRAQKLFDKDKCFKEYLNLYEELIDE